MPKDKAGERKAKCYAWTLFVTPEPEELIEEPVLKGALVDKIEYICYGLESAPDTGRVHWQGYVRFQNRVRWHQAKAMFEDATVHIEKAQGSEKENHDYCSKDHVRFTERGTYDPKANVQGKRSDLEDCAVRLKAGESMLQVADAHPGDFIRYHQGLVAYQQMAAPKPPVQRIMATIVLWGRTKVGKTHRVLTRWPDLFQVIPGRDPWGGYQGEAILFFDEFSDVSWDIRLMNRVCDKWRCRLDARYHNLNAAWHIVVICSNLDPLTWYRNEDIELVNAFRRRLTVSIEVKSIEQDVWGEAARQLQAHDLLTAADIQQLDVLAQAAAEAEVAPADADVAPAAPDEEPTLPTDPDDPPAQPRLRRQNAMGFMQDEPLIIHIDSDDEATMLP